MSHYFYIIKNFSNCNSLYTSLYIYTHNIYIQNIYKFKKIQVFLNSVKGSRTCFFSDLIEISLELGA